ncbi:glycerate kinase (plasmid) [Glaciihabitans sp. INWT7]|nr:glycerate kinase [Glaciihabitans sp. INWT7]QNE48626.1 glycerate kinase [Glaciihabitans sp. INWT7]
MRVVIAPDSFKGSIDAARAASAIAAGWRVERPFDELILLPQADGGEGTLDAIFAAVPGSQLVDVGPVPGPDGRPTPGSWLLLPDSSGVVELARVSGLPLMEKLSPLTAHTRGLSAVIAAALDAGVTALTICLGGSVSTDGGAGALSELGARLLDVEKHPISDGGGGLCDLKRVDFRSLQPVPGGGIRLLVDVDAPLLGARGSAATFGPQKGATDNDVAVLDLGLSILAGLIGTGFADLTGSGAAGGAAFGFMAAWSASSMPGAAAIAALTGLDRAIEVAGVVITGEGRFDETSSQGKVAGYALSQRRENSRAFVIAGEIEGGTAVMPTGVVGVSLRELAGSPEAAMADPPRWLYQAGREAAILVAVGSRADVRGPVPMASPDWARHR